jgi:pilus assembly protein Flp/PilA
MIAYMVAVRRHVKDDKRTRDDRGASAVEYGLLIAAIAAVIVVIVFALGSVVKSKFQKTCNEVQSQTSANQQGTTCTP